MNIKKVLEELKMPFLKRKIAHKYQVTFMPFSRTDSATIFEGHNRLGKKSKLKRSYIGFGSYVAADTMLENVYIGRYCSLGSNIKIVNGNHPTHTFVSTHPAFYAVSNASNFTYVARNSFDELNYVEIAEKRFDVAIENDVWIGNDVLLMAGITIGNGAIIGAGAVVTKDVAPYTIVVGVPARVLRKRFTNEQIGFLEDFQWWNKAEDWIIHNAGSFNNIENFMSNNMVHEKTKE